MNNTSFYDQLTEVLKEKNPLIDLEKLGFKSLTDHDVIQINAAFNFISKIDLNKIEYIADIGSGPGHQSFIFNRLGLKVSCVDFVENRYGYETIDPRKIEGRTFDAIWSHHALEHIPNPLKALVNWNNLLPIGGKIFLTVPEFDCVISSGHINSYNIPLLIYHLAIAGFSTHDKHFTKERSHIKIAAIKALSVDSMDFCTSLVELSKLNLFPPSVKNQIINSGRFDTSSLHPNWFGQKFNPRKNFNESLEFLKSSCFERL